VNLISPGREQICTGPGITVVIAVDDELNGRTRGEAESARKQDAHLVDLEGLVAGRWLKPVEPQELTGGATVDDAQGAFLRAVIEHKVER
jgi:hypothetical protein